MADTATLSENANALQPENWGLTAVRTALQPEGRTRDLPFMRTAGLSETLELIDTGPGYLTLAWRAEAPLDSYDGIIQGGMQTVVADVAQGHAFSTLLEEPRGFSTVDLSSRYLRPMPSGQTYTVETKVTEKTRRTALIETTIRRSDGKPVSHFLGSWQIVQRDFKLISA
ncbi:PaaI family thioesterase [Ponticaulis koreensis]|uniref:PaaI family thioesterase n=1 Tax=Ponticaulis koreensis TaxID=1123045 RepID=UPI0003B7AED0|nr:PaaI family thioesterase [Ponticaulis koreensis]